MPKMLSVKDVCDLLGVCDATVYKLLQTGQLTGVRVGHVWRISQKHLDHYTKGNPNDRTIGADST